MGNHYIYRVGQFIVCYLPIQWAYALAIVLANIQCFISTTDRQAVASNLNAVLKRPATPQEIREVFQNFARYMVDFLSMTKRVDHQFIKNNIVADGIEYLNDALAAGKGGIIVSAHLGNWEMGGAIFPLLGYPVAAVALTHQDPQVNIFFNAQREYFGCAVIQTNVAVRRVIEHLKMNKLVAILAERDFGQHGVRMPFLNRTAMIPKGAAAFSIKTGAPIIPCFFIRTEQQASFKIYFDKPIYPPKGNNDKLTDKELEVYINQYLAVIERYISAYPTQWLMFRDFTI